MDGAGTGKLVKPMRMLVDETLEHKSGALCVCLKKPVVRPGK